MAENNNADWKIIGQNSLNGWILEYRNTRLNTITAPGGRQLVFNYNGETPWASVEQNGVKFIEIKAGQSGMTERITINGNVRTLAYTKVNARILPQNVGESEQTRTALYVVENSVGRLGSEIICLRRCRLFVQYFLR